MIARSALARLGLDQVWLMVSPGNPLKPRRGMAPLPDRLASARALTKNRRIAATAIESRLGTTFTADTLRRLQTAFPHVRFVWLTGADNFAELPRWHRWRSIVRRIPIAIFPRPGAAGTVTHAQAAQYFRHARQTARAARILAQTAPPAWLLLPTREDSVSSTEIRAKASGD